MKTQKFKSNQLLKLYLLKSRAYEHPIKKTKSNDLITASLDQSLISVKKALQVIFQYQQTNKRILFIGLPSKLELKINSLTRHIAISSSFNIQGMISNNNKNSLHKSVKRSSIALTSKFTKKSDLIVLFNHEKSSVILAEAWVAKTPVISFVANNNFINSFTRNVYLVNGNLKSILSTFDKNIFFIGLNFIFKNLKKKKVSSSLDLAKLDSKFSKKNGKRSVRKSK
jgi:ribosomal protein S2